MPDPVSPYTASRPQQVTQMVDVPMNCWQLIAEEGSTNTHPRFVFTLRHKNSAGAWDDSIAPQRVEIEDFPAIYAPDGTIVTPARSVLTGERGQKANLPADTADHLRLLLFGAVIPDGPLAQAYGASGLSVQDAGAAILKRLLAPGA